MNKIQFTTYDKRHSNKDKDRKRKPKIEVSFEVNEIMALTTARGAGKWPFLYVIDYSEPLELPEQSFAEVKAKLMEASLREYQNVNKFISVGQWCLVNYDRVYQVKKISGEIVFFDNTILDQLDEHSLAEFESQVERIKQKQNEQHDKATRWWWDNWERLKKEATLRRDDKFTKLFGTTERKMVIIIFLMLLNIILMLILIILSGIVLSRL